MLKKFEDKMQKSYENMTVRIYGDTCRTGQSPCSGQSYRRLLRSTDSDPAGGQCLCSRSTHDPDPAMGAESARRDRESDHDV